MKFFFKEKGEQKLESICILFINIRIQKSSKDLNDNVYLVFMLPGYWLAYLSSKEKVVH